MKKIAFSGTMLMPDDTPFFETLVRLGIKIKQLGNGAALEKDESELEISVADAQVQEFASARKPRVDPPSTPPKAAADAQGTPGT